MEERSYSFSSDQQPSENDGVLSALEIQLSSVVERDGAVMLTPLGTRKKARRSDGVRSLASVKSEHFLSHASATAADPVEAFDRAGIEFVIRKVEGGRKREIVIKTSEHVRSPYVVSLQNVVLSRHASRAPEERVHVGDAHGYTPGVNGMPVEVYATVSSDLSGGVYDPHLFVDQFTPAEFDEAYRRVYGRFDGLRRGFSDIGSAFTSLFQRAERIEQQVMEDVESSIGLVEVRRFSFARALLGFVGLAMVVTVPAQAVALYRSASTTKDATQAQSELAVNDLMGATTAGSLPASAAQLEQASSQFRSAAGLLGDANGLAIAAASVMPKQYRSAQALLEIGDKAANAASLLAQGFEKIFSDPTRAMDERLDVLGAYARSALALLSDANKAAQTVDPSSVPAEQQAKVKELLSKLDASTQAVQEIAALSDVMAQVVGKDSLRDYLLVFQNPTELRPTGGFMGSFAELKMDQGKVTGITVPGGGTYDVKGQLTVRLAAPKPMQLINPVWQFQDSNWFPDFPTSADKIKYFWSKSGGPTLDGVIAINATFVEKLLAITGPIEMPAYGKTITGDNFLIETQKSVEVEYDKTANTPKKFIGDLADAMRARISSFTKDDWVKVAGLVSQSLEKKDIQVALSRPEEEAVVERYGWNGRLKQTDGDSLALIETNIAGQKTDGVITENVDQQVTVHEDGTITEEVALRRTHTGQKGDLFRGVRNVSYLRAYVPQGSTLLSATGFNAPDAKLFKAVEEGDTQDPTIADAEQSSLLQNGADVFAESGHTVFGGWMQLDPGNSQSIVLSYRLPFTVQELMSKVEATSDTSQAPRAAYTLLLTSQSGKENRHVNTSVSFPESWKVDWSRPVIASSTSLGLQRTWDRDLVLAALLTPKP